MREYYETRRGVRAEQCAALCLALQSLQAERPCHLSSFVQLSWRQKHGAQVQIQVALPALTACCQSRHTEQNMTGEVGRYHKVCLYYMFQTHTDQES